MAQDVLKKMLEINTRIEQGSGATPTNSRKKNVASKQDLDRLIEDYDRQVYGPAAQTQGQKSTGYSAEAEMQRLKEIEERGGRGAVNLEGKNIPKEIVESILNNPLDLNPDIVDPKMNALEEKLANSGIKAAVDVMKRVDEQEKKAPLITETRVTNGESLDYDKLKQIIEECIDDKLNSFKTVLNESKGQQYVPAMKLLNFKDGFYFVDSEDNVFECVMKYKGKRKKKA
jgi:hypothetical protein